MSKRIIINNSTHKICKCQLDKCLTCPKVALEKNLCTKCNIGYYPKENDITNLGEYINCYNEIEGYYLDINIYKKCYYTCKTCEIKGNDKYHNCLICNSNYAFELYINNYKNCYDNYYKIIERISNESNITKEEEIKNYDTILKYIENNFTSYNYNTSNLENGNEKMIKLNKIKIILTTTENQNNKTNENISTIYLGNCEKILREHYNISDESKIYMKKIEVPQEGLDISNIEYDLYYKKNNTNLIQMNKLICKHEKIFLYIPIDINDDNIDKYNPKSGYYNDICYITKSVYGTDISLKDRKNDYIKYDKVLCQDNCDISNYDKIYKKAKCSCIVESTPDSIINMNIDKDKLINNFKDIKNIANIKFLKCYKTLFNKNNIKSNIGFYIFDFIGLFRIIVMIIFIIYKYRKLLLNIKNNTIIIILIMILIIILIKNQDWN